MANILLLDDCDVAGRAMRGILGRAGHRCVVSVTHEEAWRLLREAVTIDLVFVELRTEGDSGMGFLQRVRDDPYWKKLPLVVYTTDTEATQVRRALNLKVQNYLVKPYQDPAIYAEIGKALSDPWRNPFFEEPKSFCAQMGIPAEALTSMRRQLMQAWEGAANAFPRWAQARENAEVFARLDALAGEAEAAGVWAGVDYLRDLRAQAERGNWAAFAASAEYLVYASRLIFCQLHPTHVPDVLKPPEERDEARLQAERTRWMQADVDACGPVISLASLQQEIKALPGCPIVDSAAAVFQMTADGRVSSTSRVMELAHEDPGICAQALIAANRLERENAAPLEDPGAAVTMLGEIRLNGLARSTVTIPGKYLDFPPLSWAAYWTFVAGVAKVSQFICEYLDFRYLSATAYTAGLLHDLGKLLLLHVHPWGFAATAGYARDKKLPLAEAERRYLGCTTRDLAVEFGTQHPLPPVYVEVIRALDHPERSVEHAELVAIVALARQVCLHHRLGYGGEIPADACPPLAGTTAWQVLESRLFPSFDFRRFEALAHAYCRGLKTSLIGRQPARAPRQEARGGEPVRAR